MVQKVGSGGPVTSEDGDLSVDVEAKAGGKIGAHVIAEIGNIADGINIANCPEQSNAFRIDWDDPDIDLNNVNQAFNEIYSYNGSGVLIGFRLDFNDHRVLTRLEIDGVEIFNVDCQKLYDSAPSGGEDGGEGQGPVLTFSRQRDVLKFEPNCAIRFATNVTIEAKANSSSNSRDLDNYWVHIRKES